MARHVALGLVLGLHAPPDPYKKLWAGIWNAKVPSKVALHCMCGDLVLVYGIYYF